MMNLNNLKVGFTLLSKGMGITFITMMNTFFPLNAFAQEPSCVNFWTNPSTGEQECFNSEMTVIAEPKPVLPQSKPLSYNSSFLDRYNIGGQEISIPSPDRYVRATQEMDGVYRLQNATQDPYNDLLAFYIPQSEVKMAMQGEIPTSAKGFYLKVMKVLKSPSLSPQDFAMLKKEIKTQNKEILNSNNSKLQEIVRENGESMGKELGVDLALNVSEVIPLDSHYESENIFSYSIYLVTEISAMGEQEEYVTAATLTLANLSGKVVSFYSYGEQADLEWTRKASRAWAEKAIANNRSLKLPYNNLSK